MSDETTTIDNESGRGGRYGRRRPHPPSGLFLSGDWLYDTHEVRGVWERVWGRSQYQDGSLRWERSVVLGDYKESRESFSIVRTGVSKTVQGLVVGDGDVVA